MGCGYLLDFHFWFNLSLLGKRAKDFVVVQYPFHLATCLHPKIVKVIIKRKNSIPMTYFVDNSTETKTIIVIPIEIDTKQIKTNPFFMP